MSLGLLLAVVAVELGALWLWVRWARRRSARREALRMHEARLKALTLVDYFEHTPVRGPSRDRQLSGKARREQRRRDRLPLDSFDVPPPVVSDPSASSDFDD